MKKLFLFILCFALVNLSFGQTAEVRDVRKKEFRGVYPILNKQTNQPKGYYTFYVNEKAGDGMVNFVIAIFDLDLKLIKQTPITISKRSEVDGSEFNGEDFMFIFNDVSKKKLTYVTVDSKGDIIKTKGIEEKKMATTTADVYPSNTGGFFVVKPIKEKKYGYSVEKVDRNLNTLWEKRFVPEKGFIGVEAIESGGDRIVIIQLVKPTITSKKAKADIVCLNDKSGETLYTYPLFDGVSTCVPSSFLIDDQKNIVTGGMFFEGEKMDAVNSDGIFFLKLSPDGQKMMYSKTGWDAGIQEVLKKAKKGVAISSKPKVYFQDIIQGKDGGYQVISEAFQKNMQLVSSALKDVVTGRYIGWINYDDSKPVTFEIMDFLIFNFDKEGKMTNLNLIEKDHTKISVYYPYNGYAGLAMAKKVDAFGWFNYGFTTKLEGSNDDVLISSNFAIGTPYIGINTIKAGEVSEMHKIPVDKRTCKGGSVGAMQGKPGEICIYLYDKKEELIFMYKEPIKMK